ncbi:MAG: DUF4340 domain-containing protein [Spirochaetaceae bacterium]|jgi:hypothetical protein|nr:DUF4340 domain-containing protein [Spirochaetaceae bacterium]
MNYRKKVTILSVITGALALTYAALLVFSPDRIAARGAYYAWLEAGAAEQADRIELGGGDPLNLVKRGGDWYAEYQGEEYPARASRVEDLLAALSGREAYALRGGSASAHERLGLGEGSAARIVLRRGVSGEVLLDLLAGNYDATGREVYYRKAGLDEVRSGSSRIMDFLSFSRASWYDLRLFPKGQDISLDRVSRVTVIPPAEGEAETLILERDRQGWLVEGLPREDIDVSKIEPYIRTILSAEGDDYILPEGDDFSAGRIVLETAEGSLYIRLGAELPRESDTAPVKRRARVSPSERVLSLSSWTLSRLFQNRDYFSSPGGENQNP